MKTFLVDHFDTIITVFVTIMGFVITYIMTSINFHNEIQKDKMALVAQEIQTLPYDICQLMDDMIKNTRTMNEDFNKEYSAILSRVLAYGSNDAIKIAIKMQRMSYEYESQNVKERNYLPILASFSLLITQLKYDMTYEIVSPESWCKLRLKDYNSALQADFKKQVNSLVEEVGLSVSFRV
ncbi:hypothetical protein [Butyrivibrio sp. XPD2002]|uniref:hypothetical protein n=1 Tax=Butyrivibrio sp. XPD2002 TaxID=1280665 RepID=UPI00047D561A|nr:hypothetical protein [Butyrivibrio sp. XPD2002]